MQDARTAQITWLWLVGCGGLPSVGVVTGPPGDTSWTEVAVSARLGDMTTPRQTAAKMADAAQAWLERLDDEQRPVAQWAGPADDVSEAERRRWFYTPTDHGGLTMQQQRPAQQRAAMTLVAAGLSVAGYVTVATIMGLENVLDRVEGFVTRFDRERGRDPGLYYLRVFGTPGDTGAWGYRFGGHHVSLKTSWSTASWSPPHRASWVPTRPSHRFSAAR